MKRIVVTLFLIAMLLNCNAINHYMPKRAAGISILPDYGLGVNYTRYVGHFGIYADYAHNIKMYSSTRFDKSQKISVGLQYLIYDNTTKYPAYFSAGASYNTYSGIVGFYSSNPKVTQPFDFQVGCGAMLDIICIGFRYDVIKNDAAIDLKVNFGKQIIKTKKHIRR